MISLLPNNLKWTVVVIVFLNVKLSIYVGHMAGFLSITGIVLEILKTWVFISYVVCFKCFTFSSEVLFTGFFQFFFKVIPRVIFSLKKKSTVFHKRKTMCSWQNYQRVSSRAVTAQAQKWNLASAEPSSFPCTANYSFLRWPSACFSKQFKHLSIRCLKHRILVKLESIDRMQ